MYRRDLRVRAGRLLGTGRLDSPEEVAATLAAVRTPARAPHPTPPNAEEQPVLIAEPVRAFLELPHFAVMATINASGTPQLTVMWYALLPDQDVVVLNATRGLLKDRNLRRDPRMAICVEEGMRYVTLTGTAELVDDRAQQEREVNDLIAPRYIGQRLGARRWEVIEGSDRIGIRMRVEKVHARGI
jgi:PPOX class probable F420-dependent enzyme